MSTKEIDTNEPSPIQIDDWNGLYQYSRFLGQGSEKDVKICVIDEEQEEILVKSQEEFNINIEYAQKHGIPSLTFVVYIDGKHIFNGVYSVAKPVQREVFPREKLQILFDNVLADKWYIPVKSDEAFGLCLTAAIHLAQENQLETVNECREFVEKIVPDAFRKLQNTPSVRTWSREIQCGIFDLIELLVDLVGTRLRHPPVPITLLNTLALAFDTTTVFSQKHKKELLPGRRQYTLKDGDFLSNEFDQDTFGWLRSIIQRFIAQNGLVNIRLQFEYIDSSNPKTAANEYTALLKLFAKCRQCINVQRFRTLFIRPIRQVIDYLQARKCSHESTDELKELKETLYDICCQYEMKDEIKKFANNSSIETCSEITPLIEIANPVQRKSKNLDCFERLSEDIKSISMTNHDDERKSIKKQRTDEQVPTPLFTRNHLLDCIDELLTTTDHCTLKRKYRRQQHSTMETNVVNKQTTNNENYDRSNPEDIRRHYAPMKLQIANMYDQLQTATSNGNLREVVKIEEKLKLLRPFSARFIGDENAPDGTLMAPGQIFRKGWIVLNDGSMPWDSDDIQLINLSNGIEVLQQPIIPVTAPHTRTVITVDYRCANEAGIYESKWILAYRQKTFGPMIWCSIEVNAQKTKTVPTANILDDFEFVEVPLPACFDLSKPFQSPNSSLYSSFIAPLFVSTEPTTNQLDFDLLQSSSTSESLSTTMSLQPTIVQNNECTIEPPTQPLIELPPTVIQNDERTTMRLNPPLDFVDTVVTNIFSVAKQAGSTAKAIFNTLQAIDETNPPPMEEPKPVLINTVQKNEPRSSGLLDSFMSNRTSIHSTSSNDPMQTLINMGFANRVRNQRLLRENANDLAKVIELLSLDSHDDGDWFSHRH